VHALGNVSALSLQLASYVARRRGHRGLGIALGSAGTGLTAAAGYLGGTLTLDKGMGVNHTVFEDSIATPAAAPQPAWRVQVVDERLQVRSAQP